MDKKVLFAVFVVVIAAVLIWIFFGGRFDPNAPHVNLNIANGNGYSNTLNGSPNYHYECVITNTGTLAALNVRLEVRFYGMSNVVIGTETASIGDIPAGATKNVSIDVPCPTQPIYRTDVIPWYDVQQ